MQYETQLKILTKILEEKVSKPNKRLPTYLSRGSSPIKSSISSKIGPGTYNFPNEQPRALSISNSPRMLGRLEHSLKCKLYLALNLYHRERKDNNYILRNLQAASRKPNDIVQSIRERAKRAIGKTVEYQKNRHNIYSHKQETYLNSVFVKSRRLYFHGNRKEIFEVKVGWGTVITGIGLAFTLSRVYQNKRAFKIRCRGMLQLFTRIVRCVGRFKLILKTLRRRKAFSHTKLLFGPFSVFLSEELGKTEDRIDRFFDRYQMSKFLSKALFHWIYKIKLIQRNWRIYMRINLLRRSVLQHIWEKRTSENIVYRKDNRGQSIYVLNQYVPQAMKMEYIDIYIKKTLKEYASMAKTGSHSYLQLYANSSKIQIYVMKARDQWRKKITKQDNSPTKSPRKQTN